FATFKLQGTLPRSSCMPFRGTCHCREHLSRITLRAIGKTDCPYYRRSPIIHQPLGLTSPTVPWVPRSTPCVATSRLLTQIVQGPHSTHGCGVLVGNESGSQAVVSFRPI